MPNRILRAELLDSEPWLALKDNADRAAYISCLLTVDTFGNMPAGPQRLVKLWRPYGIDTPEKAAKVLADLGDVDLVRAYHFDRKMYLHIPRFNQSRRFLGHLWPLSPWTTNEEKQRVAQKSLVNHESPPVILSEPPIGVGVGVGVGVGDKAKTKPLSGSPKPANTDDAIRLLEFLNRKAERRFRPTAATLKPIIARLQEYTYDECLGVIVQRWVRWGKDPKMAEYLRPDTLFAASKFAQYVGDVPTPAEMAEIDKENEQ